MPLAVHSQFEVTALPGPDRLGDLPLHVLQGSALGSISHSPECGTEIRESGRLRKLKRRPPVLAVSPIDRGEPGERRRDPLEPPSLKAVGEWESERTRLVLADVSDVEDGRFVGVYRAMANSTIFQSGPF